jgi:lipoprotein signal peptidase
VEAEVQDSLHRFIHVRNIQISNLTNFRRTNPKTLLPISMLAFYHSLPQGFYFGFLSHYTNYLMLLMIYSAAFYIYSIFYPEAYLKWVPFLPIFIGLWSSLFLVMWKRREKELAYCFDSFEEEFDKP